MKQSERNSKERMALWITVFLGISATMVQAQSTIATTDTSSDAEITPTTAPSAQSKTAAPCGLNGNTDTICSPIPGDTWYNGTWYQITWNPLYPSYVSSSTLDIYIYFVQNYQNRLIKKLSDVNTAKGSIPILVDDTWRLDPTAQTYENMVYIVPSGVNAENELNNRLSDYPPPIHNLVAQAAIMSPLTTSNATSSSKIVSNIAAPTNQIPITPPLPPSSSNLSNLSGNQLPQDPSHTNTIHPGIIAAIVLACLAVLGACAAIAWVMRHSRRRNLVYGEKGHLELNSRASSSMFHTVHVDGSSGEKLGQSGQNNSAVSISNGFQNYSNFSAADPASSSLLTTPTRLHGTAQTGSKRGSSKSQIAPTTPVNSEQFGFISEPSLPFVEDHAKNNVYLMDGTSRFDSATSFSNISSRSEPPLTSTDALLIADTFRQRMRRPDWQTQQQQNQEEDNKRRQLSEELLKTELEAEGTLMKKVGKRARLLASTYQQQDQDTS